MFIYFWLCWVIVALLRLRLSLVAESRVSSLRCVCGGAGLVLEHALQVCELQQLRHMGSLVAAQGLIYSAACGIFRTRDQTPGPCVGRWILIHCTTREVRYKGFFLSAFSPVIFFFFFLCNPISDVPGAARWLQRKLHTSARCIVRVHENLRFCYVKASFLRLTIIRALCHSL